MDMVKLKRSEKEQKSVYKISAKYSMDSDDFGTRPSRYIAGKIRLEDRKSGKFIVHRNSKGHIINSVKRSKGVTLAQARINFKKGGSIIKEERVESRDKWNVAEVTIDTLNPKIRRGRDYQFVTKAVYKFRGKTMTVYGRSQQFSSRKLVEKMREQSEEAMYTRLAEKFGFDYDESIGKSLVSNYPGRFSIYQYVVYYIDK